MLFCIDVIVSFFLHASDWLGGMCGDKNNMVAEPSQRYHASDWLGGMWGDWLGGMRRDKDNMVAEPS